MNLKTRQGSRICAMQILYSRETGGEDPSGTQDIAMEVLPLDKADGDYMKSVLEGVAEHQEEIDAAISRYAVGWKIDRLPKVDLSILRLGIFELFWRDDIPDKATINECVEMAKHYSTPEAGSYINGILSSCLKEKQGDTGEEMGQQEE